MMRTGKLDFSMGLMGGLVVYLSLNTLNTLISMVRPNRFTGAFRHATRDSHDSHFSSSFAAVQKKMYSVHEDSTGGDSVQPEKFDDLRAHYDDDSVAKEMASRVRVLVWVMTSPQNLDKKAIHVQNTWGKRANTLLFMSSQWNSSFPTIGLNVSEGRQNLPAKTFRAFRYIYENHFDDADWFMKADDDTYVIMENLRYMLSAYDTEDPIYFGQIFKPYIKQGYASGGAGYVISKEALRRFATKGMRIPRYFKQRILAFEDVEMGNCLMKLGVQLVPSLDRLGRTRFHCFWPQVHIMGELYPKWYLKFDANGAKRGIANISEYPITFHYMLPPWMYATDYFVYHLRPVGIAYRLRSLNNGRVK
ncbi:hypothetical protein ACOMHN_029154 [Nucella lapillus]